MKTLPSFRLPYLPCLLFAVIFIASGCSKKTVVSSEWKPQPIVVDGDASDWSQPLRYTNSKTFLTYSIANDGDNLYFCFITADRRTQAKFALGGMLIKIEFPGTNSPPATLLYPIPGSYTFPKRENNDKSEYKNPLINLPQEATSLQVSGFPFAATTSALPLLNNLGVHVATSITSDERLIYEAVVPLKGLKMNSDKETELLITVRGIPREKTKGSTTTAMPNSMGNMGPGGRPGGYTGQRGGYYNGGYMNNVNFTSSYSTLFADQKMSLKMKLSSK